MSVSDVIYSKMGFGINGINDGYMGYIESDRGIRINSSYLVRVLEIEDYYSKSGYSIAIVGLSSVLGGRVPEDYYRIVRDIEVDTDSTMIHSIETNSDGWALYTVIIYPLRDNRIETCVDRVYDHYNAIDPDRVEICQILDDPIANIETTDLINRDLIRIYLAERSLQTDVNEDYTTDTGYTDYLIIRRYNDTPR